MAKIFLIRLTTGVGLFLILSSFTSKGPSVDNLESALIAEAASVDAITQENVHHTLGTKCPPHLTNITVSITGEALYWRATEDGLTYAESFDLRDAANVKHREYNTRLNWDWGFRLGISYTFDWWDDWDLSLNWTKFNSENSKTRKNSGTSIENYLAPFWGASISPVVLTKAKSEWELHYSTLDLELGRNYFISKDIALRPHLGLRAAFIHQDYDVTYEGFYDVRKRFFGTSTPVIVISDPGVATMDARDDFNGLGVRAGSDFIWHFTNHFGIVGKISAALLFGSLKVDQDYRGNQVIILPGPVFALGLKPLDVNKNRKFHRVQANLEFCGGVQWEMDLNKRNDRLTLSILYDFTEWFSINQLVRTDYEISTFPPPERTLNDSREDRISSDLGLNGFSFVIKFDF